MSKTFRAVRRALVSTSLLALGLVAVPAATSVVHAAGLEGGGEFHPLTPQRIYDSRDHDGGPIGEPAGAKAITPDHSPKFDINVLGVGSELPADALLQGARGRGQHHRHRGQPGTRGAGRRARGLRQRGAAGHAVVAAQLPRRRRGLEQRFDPQPWRQRQADHRPVRRPGHGTCCRRRLRLALRTSSEAARRPRAGRGSFPLNPGRILDTRRRPTTSTAAPGRSPVGANSSITGAHPWRGLPRAAPSPSPTIRLGRRRRAQPRRHHRPLPAASPPTSR